MMWNFPHFFIFLEELIIKDLLINGQIRDREVRLIGQEGEQLGIHSSYDAQRMADDLGLDLVKISPTAIPPVCKIMDYGRYRYEQIRKEKAAKKNQATVEMKEVRLSMTIDDNDIATKAKQSMKFLKDGNKVKVTLRMRGRQQAYANQGVEISNNFYEIVKEYCTIERQPLTEGRNIIMILAPIANKAKQ